MDEEHRVVVSVHDEDIGVMEVRTLDLVTGQDASRRSWSGSVESAELVEVRGSILVRADGRLSRIHSTDLQAEPEWQISAVAVHPLEIDSPSGGAQDGFVALTDDRGEEIGIAAVDEGDIVPWFGGPGMSYDVIGGIVIRRATNADQNGDTDRFEVVSTAGEILWSDEVEQLEVHPDRDGEVVVYEVRREGLAQGDSRITQVERRAPRDGSALWERSFQSEFNAVTAGTEGNSLFVDWDAEQTTIVDPASGTALGTLPTAGFVLGESPYYQLQDGAVLRAWRADGQHAWTRVVGDGGEAIAEVPGTLITYNDETGEMTRWG